jgi:hypothetical protein
LGQSDKVPFPSYKANYYLNQFDPAQIDQFKGNYMTIIRIAIFIKVKLNNYSQT